MPDPLADALADAVLRISWSYVGREELMCEHLLAVLADVNQHEVVDVDLYRTHFTDDRGILALAPYRGSRRRPSLYEAVVETCRRLRDTRALREALGDTSTSGLLVGSTSYAPFSYVRGNRYGAPASDLDLLVVIDDSRALDAIVSRLSRLSRASARDVDYLAYRAQIFTDRLDDGRTVFSHKIETWPEDTPDPLLPSSIAPADYLLSLHFMTTSALDHILVGSTPRLAPETAGASRTVHDYREVPRGEHDHVRTFAGRSYHLPLETVAVDGGCLRSPRVYHLDEFDAYCPGFYQMMLIPQPDMVWDRLDVRPALHRFRAKLADRVRYEAGRHPHALVRPSFAHVRREVFNPYIIRLLDEGY
ncbi:hypothetical protein GCM10009764_78450 [Nocardia ninae]|uniref:Uncharacterized protein n=1 Tax=Nocardia ninae NBRC 108245 TaxID=1210091 RepID=A0A511MCR8_9NOCA|nr:hypothetical protein NN4_29830 [Nocardia ninae NBRC 108245]